VYLASFAAEADILSVTLSTSINPLFPQFFVNSASFAAEADILSDPSSAVASLLFPLFSGTQRAYPFDEADILPHRYGNSSPAVC